MEKIISLGNQMWEVMNNLRKWLRFFIKTLSDLFLDLMSADMRSHNVISSRSRTVMILTPLDCRAFLAHLVMSLCNHSLSVVWCCHCHWHQHQCHQHQHHHWCLCTALPVTALTIETPYLANICSYTPSICTWNIRSIWHIFFKWQPF